MPLVHRKDYRHTAGVDTPCGMLTCLGFQPDELCVLFQLSQGDAVALACTDYLNRENGKVPPAPSEWTAMLLEAACAKASAAVNGRQS